MRKLIPFRKKNGNKKEISIPVILIGITILLSVIGAIFVFEASSIRALQMTGDSLYYLKLQIQWIVVGSIFMGFFSLFRYKKLYPISLPLIGVVVLLLVAVLIPSIGHTVGGSRRWIDLGFFNLQPSELAKFSAIIYLASWFSKKEKKRFIPFVIFIGSFMGLIFLQPDMGTAIIFFSLSTTIYFLAGQELVYLLSLVPLAFGAFFILVLTAPYRMHRLLAFLNPAEDPLGIGFHINQILISLAQGGLLGRGFGASRQKYLFLPEAHTDSIFAIIGEELGFVGSFLILFCYIIFLYKLYQIYTLTGDRYGKILVGGICSFFGFQILVNLGGMVNLIPLTGVTLPFLSYGGSSIITSFMLVGIAINIYRNRKNI